MKKRLSGILSAFGMLVLILDAKTAITGAKEGIELCLMTIIPSLFPFFVLSILLTTNLSGARSKFLRPIGRLCKMPEGSESLLLIGLLGGYPTGAQAVTQTYESGFLGKEQAQRLLAFCSNAGPAFLFGICGSLFPEKWMVWMLWAVHVLSALAVAIVLPGETDDRLTCSTASHISLPQALDRALKTAARVCGWVVLFRIVIAFSEKWILRQTGMVWTVWLSGLLELTNGCCQLSCIENIGLRFLLASLFLAFGGICVTMQTVSVTASLGIGTYVRGKLLQTVFSILLSLLLQAILFTDGWKIHANPILLMIPACYLLFVLIKYEKKSSIPARSLV